MASQNVTPASPPAAHVVGKAFVEQYYHILHLSPDMVHRFYQDSSILGRPDLHGIMTSVTTMQAINEKIMSLNYEDYKFEIENVDAQNSYKEGVLVLVTGSLIGKDNIRQKFTQSFFLAPQDKGGYFVLNDVFRFVGENQTKEDNTLLDDATHGFAINTPASSNPGTLCFISHIQVFFCTMTFLGLLYVNWSCWVGVYHVTANTNPISEEDIENGAEVSNLLESDGSVVEEEPVDQPVKPSHHDAPPGVEVTTTIEEDVPKKSYASIVKVMKGNSTPSAIHVPPAKAKVAPTKIEKQASSVIPVPAPETATPSKNDVHESSNSQEEVEGHSIYVRNLPLNAIPADVEEEFKKFGSIKPGGVQVRNHRQYGYCFGFVEFESENSMLAAIEAAPVMMGTQRVIVEAKRTTTRVVDGGSSNTGGRGQFPLGRGGFRNESRFYNDNFRGRGSFSSGGQGYGRNEFRSRGGFPVRGRGVSSRAIGVYQNGGRNFRPSGMMNQIAVPV